MVQRMNNAFSFAHGEGKAYWFNGTLMEMKAMGNETNGAFSLIEGTFPAGYQTPLHIKSNEEDIYYVLEGEIIFTLGETIITGKPGTFVYAPRGIQHKFEVVESSPAKMLVMYTPAGVEQFFMELGEPAKELKLPPADHGIDMNEFIAVVKTYGVEILG